MVCVGGWVDARGGRPAGSFVWAYQPPLRPSLPPPPSTHAQRPPRRPAVLLLWVGRAPHPHPPPLQAVCQRPAGALRMLCSPCKHCRARAAPAPHRRSCFAPPHTHSPTHPPTRPRPPTHPHAHAHPPTHALHPRPTRPHAQAELLRLEFEHYDWRKQGSMSGRDFAHSVVGCARMKHLDAYLDKVHVHGRGGGVIRVRVCARALGRRVGALGRACRACAHASHQAQHPLDAHPPIHPPPPDAPTAPTQVASLPPDLAASRVTRREFEQFRGVWRQLRSLAGGWVGVGGERGRACLGREGGAGAAGGRSAGHQLAPTHSPAHPLQPRSSSRTTAAGGWGQQSLATSCGARCARSCPLTWWARCSTCLAMRTAS